MTPLAPRVRAHDLSLRYLSDNPLARDVVVDGVSFDIAQGEVLAIIGETGSGKSSLAKAVALEVGLGTAGSPRIVGGTLDVLGTPVRKIRSRRRSQLSGRIGYLRQEAGDYLEPRFTVGESVAEPIFLRNRKFDQNVAGQAVATLIDAVRLPLNTMNKYPYELSKGQRQLVAIARALILDPPLVVADNPTAGIDTVTRSAVLGTIAGLQRERGFSALIVSSELNEVRRISHRVAVMHRGIFVGIGDLDAVLAEAQHPYVKRLARSHNSRRSEVTRVH